jgi:type II secretory pathway component PulJ
MKALTKTVFALSLAGALGGVCLARNALSKARLENQRLRDESEEMERLSRANTEIERLRAEMQEIGNLRNETRELHKLRNEVRQWREQKPEWDKLRAENQRLRTGEGAVSRSTSRAADQGNLIVKELLSDAGLGSPEATFQTLLWAMREGNLEKMRTCFLPNTPSELMPGGSSPMMAGFKGFRVVAKKVVSTDEVRLGIQLSADQDVAPDEWVLPFKRVEGEWKVNLAPAR